MQYVSTRGQAPILPFDEVLLTGLASDGGLYLPEKWPTFSKAQLKQMAKLSYTNLAREVMIPYLGESISSNDLTDLVEVTYGRFFHSAVAPLKQLDHNQWLLELFHGPTLAFKDYPLQLLGKLFDHFLSKKDKIITIVGATSGDTGSAAIEACRASEFMNIFMLHPAGRISEVQRRQMTTTSSDNVYNIALEGTFDDCQDIVKALFADYIFREKHQLSAVNSINWARILVQIIYYFWSALSLGAPDRKISFSVPTGNFGNVFAGYVAKRMGLPIEKLIVATNSNDILARFFQTGQMSISDVVQTLSPSMDIQISSNFERLLFEYYKRDGVAISKLMEKFRHEGAISFGKNRWKSISRLFDSRRVNDDEISETISSVYKETGELVDPHTVTGIAAARKINSNSNHPLVCLATAHPAKFPEAVEKATGIKPDTPPQLHKLFLREESFFSLPNKLEYVREFITEKLDKRSMV